MDNCQKKSGFTLIELLSVLAIIAIVSIAAIPSWSSFSESAKLRAEGDKIISNLYSAQQGAISEQYNYVVRFNLENNSYKIIKLIADEDDPLLISEKEEGEYLIAGISLENTTFGSNELEFIPFGSPSYAGEIKLKNQKGKEFIIQISPAGIIKSIIN